MISDEELQEMVETEGRDYAEPEQLITEIATELLAYRRAERLNKVKNEAIEPECTKHVWEFHPELSPHPYVCSQCGKNMDDDCFGDDLL